MGIGACHLVRMHLGGFGGWVGSILQYISIAYYMQKVGRWVQIACKICLHTKWKAPMASTPGIVTIRVSSIRVWYLSLG